MTESAIQNGFRAWLDKQRISYLCPAFGKKSRITPGWPDFTLIHCGRVKLIESKTAKGGLSAAQKELFPILARENGTVVQVCRSVEEHVTAALEWLGIVNREIGTNYTIVPVDMAEDVAPEIAPALQKMAEPQGRYKAAVDNREAGFSPARRIGDWNGIPWLIRTDSNPETFIRKATPEDLRRYRAIPSA